LNVKVEKKQNYKQKNKKKKPRLYYCQGLVPIYAQCRLRVQVGQKEHIAVGMKVSDFNFYSGLGF
jgi:hypothetical protein